MKKFFIAGNWKMHKTISEGVALATELASRLKDSPHRLLVAPPFTALKSVADALKGTNIQVGAQNMASEEAGAHTGEISVLMLKDIGVGVVILGHSERRHVYGETDALVNAKVKLALKHGLDVILCVGETLAERESGAAKQVVKDQTLLGLKDVSETELARVTIAYEPVWAIGTGKTATPQDADEIHAYIREVLAKAYSPAASKAMTIQYGGSVKPDNVKSLMAMPNLDGALVGGAALKSDQFLPIAQFER